MENTNDKEKCKCNLGWTGADCSTKTTPVSFSANSFMQLALLFIPNDEFTSVELRLVQIFIRFQINETFKSVFKLKGLPSHDHSTTEVYNCTINKWNAVTEVFKIRSNASTRQNFWKHL